jgi:hypothetical protein
MVFTVELRYQTGSSTILSTEAETADQALDQVRDPRRALVAIRVSGPAMHETNGAPEPRGAERRDPGYRRTPAHHRRSRRGS